MTKVLRFGAYVFPDTGTDYNDNFRDLVTRTSRLPGLSGGYDELGAGRAPGEIGNVSYSLILKAATEAQMLAARDTLAKIADYGRSRLFIQPTDPDAQERFTWARVQNIQFVERYRDLPQFNLRATINWQVADPRWFTQGTEAWSWGDGTAWGAAPWGGSATPQACSGTQTDFTITTEGNATTEPRITVSCGAGQTCQNPTVQRLVNGVMVDQVKYEGTLVAGDELLVDCRALRVLLNGTSAYSTAFTFLHPAWFRLEPGANSIRVLLANSGDAASVTLRYFEAFR